METYKIAGVVDRRTAHICRHVGATRQGPSKGSQAYVYIRRATAVTRWAGKDRKASGRAVPFVSAQTQTAVDRDLRAGEGERERAFELAGDSGGRQRVGDSWVVCDWVGGRRSTGEMLIWRRRRGIRNTMN